MSNTRLPGADEVHRFWFGAFDDWATCAAENQARWFLRGRELDAPVTERFAGLLEAAMRAELEPWRESPRGTLALVITLGNLSFPAAVLFGVVG